MEALAHDKGGKAWQSEKELLINSILEAVIQKVSRLPAKEYEQLIAKIISHTNSSRKKEDFASQR